MRMSTRAQNTGLRNALREEGKRLLEQIATGHPLEDCLATLCTTLAALDPGLRAAVLLPDDQRLEFKRVITPALPPSFDQGLRGAPINDLPVGTCGTAMYYGRPVICSDIANDDKWSGPWRDLCLAHEVRACLSSPIQGLDGIVLGSLMFCFDRPRTPTTWEQHLADFGTHLASIALEREHSSETRYRTLFEAIPISCFTVGRDGQILTANRHALETIGISTMDLVGRDFASLHPRDIEHVRARIADAMRKPGTSRRWDARIQSQNRQSRWIRETACVVGNTNQNRVLLVVCEDITDERERATLAYYAAHDPLTGLLNRREFEHRLVDLIDKARGKNDSHVLGFIDLDQFKIVNDTSGHLAGDTVLRQVARLLQERLRMGDVIARLGGDEFGLLLTHCDISEGQRLANQLLHDMERLSLTSEQCAFPVGMSIGLTCIDHTTRDITQALQAADAACYQAKRRGRHRSYVYRSEDASFSRHHGELTWVNWVARALEEQRLQLAYQPIVPVAALTGGDHAQNLWGYELLLRLQDESGRCLPATQSLLAAERGGLVSRLDRWVIDTAFDWLGAHPEHVSRLGLCAINLSAQSLNDEQCLNRLHARLNDGSAAPEKICLEITETAVIDHLDGARHAVEALRALGCRVALDDFGSGLTSFSSLKALPVDVLKIDGELVQAIDQNPVDLAIVKSVNEIAHLMGKQTIAEGIESRSVLEKLCELGVDYVQGYALSVPRPLSELR